MSKEEIARMDAEANAFAMELLMPEDQVRAVINSVDGIDIEDGKAVHKLALKFRVSDSVMAIRLGQLSERVK